MPLTSNAEKRSGSTRPQRLARLTLVAYFRCIMEIRAALKNVTPCFVFLLLTATVGPLLFGYHLVTSPTIR